MSLDLCYRASSPRPGRAAGATIVATSLDAMASGGMYDHIGGGFARYSVDERVARAALREDALRPGAAGARVRPRRASTLGTDRWRQVVERDVDYVLRDLRQPGGGFSSAQDADSPGPDGHNHEGLFHTWTPDEVRAVLGDDADVGARSGTTSPTPGTSKGRVDPQPHRPPRRLAAARRRSRRPPARCSRRAAARPAGPRRQGAHRVERADDLVAGRGRRAARRADWIDAAAGRGALPARRAARRRPAAGTGPGTPTARRRPATPRSPPTTPRSSTPSPASPRRPARRLDRRGDGHRRHAARPLLGPGEGGLFTTPDDGEPLIARQKDLFDNATPSANSTAAVALFRLAALTGEARYANHADRILQLVGPLVSRGASGLLQRARRARPAHARHHRGRRRRRPPRPPRRRPRALAPRRRAGLGRALRLPAVGRPHRRPRLRLRATTPARPPRTPPTASAPNWPEGFGGGIWSLCVSADSGHPHSRYREPR